MHQGDPSISHYPPPGLPDSGRSSREVHPQGGGPVDPKPMLDRFLADALAAAPDVVTAALAAKEKSGGSDSVQAKGEPRPALPRLETLAYAGTLTPALLPGKERSSRIVNPLEPTTSPRPLPANLAEVLLGSLAAAATAGALTGSGAAPSRNLRRWPWRR